MIKPARVRTPEWMIGVSAIALAVVLLRFTWFRVGPREPTREVQYLLLAIVRNYAFRDVNGWHAMAILGPLTLVVALLGVGVVGLQASCRAPALPVCATVIELPLSFLLLVGLAIRVLLDHPALSFEATPLVRRAVELFGPGAQSVVHARPGAYVGLALAGVVFLATYASLRSDGILPGDGPQSVETVAIELPREAGSPLTGA